MAKAYIFYNPLAGNKSCMEDVKVLEIVLNDECVFCDMTRAETYENQLFFMDPEDYLILCGGDGTLNRFANLTKDVEIPNDILYFPTGTGNDFAHDLGKSCFDDPFPVSRYLKELPTVTIKDKTYRFLNGIGFGIDGYCCQVGDELRKKSDKPVNYTAIAVKGLLFHYKPTSATVTVDGEEHTYQKVWLAPTMYGRFYGGGMMPTPAQNRENEDKTLSTMVFHSCGKLRTLMKFPSIFKGTHVRYKKNVDILSGHRITVKFDRPVALQVDGETVLDVTEYQATSYACDPQRTLVGTAGSSSS